MEKAEAEKTGEASPVGGSPPAASNGGEARRKPTKKKPSSSSATKPKAKKKKKKKSESASSASAPPRQQKKKRSSTTERNAKLCSNQKKEKEKVGEEVEGEEVPEEEVERNLESLPLEVQLRMLSFLKVYDAHALARTSTYWRHLVLSEIKFWNARWQREEPQEQSRQLLFRLWRDDELLWKGRAEDHILHVFNTFYQERVAFLQVHFAFICEQLIKEVTLKLALHLKEAKRNRKTEKKKKKETKKIAEKNEEEGEEEERKCKTTNKRNDAQPDEATEKSIKHKKDKAETKREKKRKSKKDKGKQRRQTEEEAAKTSEAENNIANSNASKTQQNQTEKKAKQKKTTVKAMEKEKEQQQKKEKKKQPKQKKETWLNRAQDDNDGDGECSALSSARATVLPQIIAMLLRTIFILERPDEGVALLIKRRCVKLVLTAMECFPQHNRVQQWGCAALHNLCVIVVFFFFINIDAAEKKVMKKKGLDLVLTALDRFPDDVDVQDWGCGLVSVIAYNHTKQVLKKGALARIVSAMHNFPDQSAIQFFACVALTNFTTTEERQQKIQKELDEVLPLLFSALFQFCADDEFWEQANIVLNNLCVSGTLFLLNLFLYFFLAIFLSFLLFCYSTILYSCFLFPVNAESMV
ncbi:hypothetical protein QOT17_006871 [Balamuthia mandrillaris]